MTREKERVTTEMAIQFSEMKARLSGVEKEKQLFEKENLRLIEQLNLNKKDMFGRAPEKTSGIIGSAFADEVYENPLSEDLIPGEPPVNDACRDGGTIVSGKKRRGGGKKKGKREKDLSGVPRKTEFLLDVDELDKTYVSGNWRIFT